MNDNMRIFYNAWTQSGESGESATMLNVESRFSRGGRVVLVNASLTPDWGHGYFLARKAMETAVSGLRDAGIVTVAEIPKFSEAPAYVLSEQAGGLITTIWVNALTALESEDAWNKAIADGKAEAAILDQAKAAGDSGALLRSIAERDKLRREGRLSDIALNEELKEKTGAVPDLLKRLGIRQ